MRLFKIKKRAQAAVELLTTYGWAIMGVILVIGALSYFDVFDSKRFISERCDTGNQIQCLEAYANSDGAFRLALRNNYLVDVSVEEVWVDGVRIGYYDGMFFIEDNVTIESGSSTQFGTDDIGELIKGDKKTMDVVVVFRRGGTTATDCTSGICYNTSGVLIVKVQDADDANPIVPMN